MKNLLIELFTAWGERNLVVCCFGFQDEIEIPQELLEELK
ncbi:cyclic lactone autoinducer peptide [Enterococcus sp. BWB1-3]|nr:cyclic lactone autoinducer peptide [Enterococcus sp. BWB1-3]